MLRQHLQQEYYFEFQQSNQQVDRKKIPSVHQFFCYFTPGSHSNKSFIEESNVINVTTTMTTAATITLAKQTYAPTYFYNTTSNTTHNETTPNITTLPPTTIPITINRNHTTTTTNTPKVKTPKSFPFLFTPDTLSASILNFCRSMICVQHNSFLQALLEEDNGGSTYGSGNVDGVKGYSGDAGGKITSDYNAGDDEKDNQNKIKIKNSSVLINNNNKNNNNKNNNNKNIINNINNNLKQLVVPESFNPPFQPRIIGNNNNNNNKNNKNNRNKINTITTSSPYNNNNNNNNNSNKNNLYLDPYYDVFNKKGTVNKTCLIVGCYPGIENIDNMLTFFLIIFYFVFFLFLVLLLLFLLFLFFVVNVNGHAFWAYYKHTNVL